MKKSKSIFLCILLLSLGHPAVLPAEETAPTTFELITDRPDETESTAVIPPGYLQLEMGFSHTGDGDPQFDADSFPQTLLRLGLADAWELRLGYDGYTWERTDPASLPIEKQQGGGDPEIGFKYQFFSEDRWRPEAALITGLSLPVGKAPISSERCDPFYRLAFSHTLSEQLSLGYNLGQGWFSEKDESSDLDRRAYFLYSVALGIGLTEKWGTFLEAFGEIPTGSSGAPQNYLDAGLTYLLLNNLQFDIRVGLGLSDSADDWFLGAGLVYRFPN